MSVLSLNKQEKKLIEAIRHGDEGALKQVYSHHFESVRRLILNNNGNEHLAKDIYQETILIFVERVSQKGFQLTSTIATFIYGVARRLWLKQLRGMDFHHADIQELSEIIPSDEKGLDEVIFLDEESGKEHLVAEALKELGDPCRSLLIKYYYHQLSMQQIAEEMSYSNAANAKNQKARCMKRLRKIFKEMGGTDGA